MPVNWLPGVHAAPNIQGDPSTYELENRAVDPDGLVWQAMRRVRSWEDAVVADVGAGTGYWTPHLAGDARHVFAVEPHDASRLAIMARVVGLGLGNVSVCTGSTERLLLPDASLDFVHVRWAYFWGPGCEAGLAELERVMAPGGAVCILDNDLEAGTFAGWLRCLPPSLQRDPRALDAFWLDHGYTTERVMSGWRFQRREDLEAVVRLELPWAADSLLADHAGLAVSFGMRLIWRRF